ncbi:MAG: TonB-dependent receptor [Candidatus Acidiferrales bacterium]
MNRLKSWGVFILVLTISVTALAQYGGRILGTITDQSGGAIKDARVNITNVDTGVSRNLLTNEAGDYVAPNLPPGMYRITVEVTGFKRIERTGVRLEVAKDVRIDLSLSPGAIAETIQVTGEAPLIETTNDAQGGSFANKAINDMPLNGRDYQNLVVLRPGVQRSAGGGFLSISSNGNRPEDNNFIFDGIDNNDPYYGAQVINTEGVQGTPGSILPIDAIQEFNVMENPGADYGWKPGAIVNVGIKSGTNDVHGTAYYFGRNSALDARNFFNPAPDPKKALHLHQFGGSLGGPIIRNKTFIFGAYEGVRGLISNSETLASPATVSVGDPAVSIPDAIASVQARCAGSAVPCGVSPLSLKLAPLFPANNGTNPAGAGLVTVGFPNRNRNDNFILKGDHHFNERHSIGARYFFGDSLQVERDIPVLRPEWQSQSQYRAQVVGVNYTWNPSAHWVNEAKFGYNRFWQAILTVDHDKDPKTTYGINTGVSRPIDFGMPEIALNSFNSLGGNHGWPLETIPNETYQFSDSVSFTIGRHTLRFGGEFRRGSTRNIRDRYGKTRIRFGGGELSALCNCYPAGTDSSDLEDFIAGLPRGAFTGKTGGRIFIGDSERFVSMPSFGAFFQDDWRVTPRLTINAGLRYDLSLPIRERNNRLANFDPVNGIRQVGQGISSPYDTDYNNFGPRLGIAWDPFGKGKTVIRAGGAIIYEIPHLAIFLGQNGVNNASTAGLNVIPTSSATGIPGANGTIAANSTDFPGSSLNWTVAGPVFQPSIDCSASPCNILGVTRHLRTPYVMTWNFNIQQALGNSLSLQVGYVGNRGVKLYSIRDINQVNPALDDGGEQVGRPFNARFPFLGVINFMENGYTSIYHGLQVSVTQRPWHGLTYVLGYTWAHSIDFASLNRAAQPQNSLRADLERGNSDLDIRHRLTLALTYNLPSRKGWGQLLEGWQVNSLVTVSGGTPWGLTDGFANGNDISLTGEFSDRWNIFGDAANIKASPSGGIPFFNFSDAQHSNASCLAHASLSQLQSFGCFAEGGTVIVPPEFGQFGTMGRNTFRGPRLDNWDFSLVKTTKITERFDIQLRAEFFNILNHPHFANPFSGGSLGNVDPSVPSTFGFASATPDVAAANPVIGTGGARNIQLGIKFRF